MSVSIELVKKIREATGAGLNDVKEALDEAQGDEEKVLEILRKRGQKLAAKKSERTAKEGVIAIYRQGNKVAVIGLNCETDFVARNQEFVQAAESFASQLWEMGEADFKPWAEAEIKNNLIVKLGENLQLAFSQVIAGTAVGSYLHSNKKLAAVVVLNGGHEDLAKEVAMQVTAMSPQYNRPADVPAEVIDKEKEIYREQLRQAGKPDEMIEKILDGKINKFYTEVCLIKQPFVKDDKISIEKLLNGVEVERFSKFSL